MNTIPQLWCIRAGVEFIHFCVVLPQLVMFMSVYLAWEFYRNAYQQAAGLLKILQGFAHGRHAAPKFLPLDKNATTRVSVRWHWGVDVEATVIKVSHTRFPHHSVRADRGRAVQHKTDWITDPPPVPPHQNAVKHFSALVHKDLSKRTSLESGWETEWVLRVVEVGTTAAMQRAKLRPPDRSRTSPSVWKLLSPYPDVDAWSF